MTNKEKYSYLTEKQFECVTHNQGNALVSASAGSGKTHVVIERIITLILDKKTTVDKILAVTFTKLAAQEMKDKLKKALIKEINNGRDDLKNELESVYNADISTIHSFCSNLIKKYFYVLGIDSNFEVLDEIKRNALIADSIEEVLNDYYEKGDKDFLKVISFLSSKRKDSSFKKTIVSLINYVDSSLDEDEIFNTSYYTHTNAPDIFNKVILKDANKVGRYFQDKLMPFITIFNDDEKRLNGVKSFYNLSTSLATCTDLYDFSKVNANFDFSFPSKPRQKDGEDLSIYDDIKFYKDELKSYYNFILSIFGVSKQETLKILSDNTIIINVLENIVKDCLKTYTLQKREENYLDFSDLEKLCYNLLQNNEILESVRNQYKYIFVDEYQDVNSVQEAIINLISNNNTFMVGDSKQSIYAFRGCKPKYFIDKYKKFNSKENPLNSAISLDYNFRCAPNIIKGVNSVFTRIFSKDFCEFDYRDNPMQQLSTIYGENLGECSLHLYTETEEEATSHSGVYSVKDDFLDNINYTYTEQEMLVADLIEKALDSEYYDFNDKCFKKIELKDIVLLTRSFNSKIIHLINSLSEMGIPISAQTDIKITKYPEIKAMICLVKALCSLNDDISLATTMATIYSFTFDELSEIRKGQDKKCSFYDAVISFSTNNGNLNLKVKEFLENFNNLRLLAEFLSAEEILYKIFRESGYETKLLSTKFGTNKVQRVEKFINESTKNKKMSIKEFAFHIEEATDNITSSQTAGQNSVTIMTMHASKGLEFPCVILVNVSGQKSNQDKMPSVVRTDEFGLSSKHYDDVNMVKTATPLSIFTNYIMNKNDFESESRILYVAMTRAKYILNIVVEKDTLFTDKDNFLIKSPNKLSKYISLSDMPYYEYSSISKKENNDKPTSVAGKLEENLLSKEIIENFNYDYKYKPLTTLPVKMSVSEINHKHANEEYYPVKSIFPSSSKDKGSAYHHFLEVANFYSDAKSEYDRVVKENLLSSEELSLISVDDIVEIFNMDIFNDIKDYTLYKEQKFCYLADPILVEHFDIPNELNGKVLVQGIIDLMAIKDDDCILIDYKLSSITDETALINNYKKQLLLYKTAIENNLKLTVTKVCLINILTKKCIVIE